MLLVQCSSGASQSPWTPPEHGTFQGFLQRGHESLELHLLHGRQHIPGIQGFPLPLHGKVICTRQNEKER